jgi:transposase-like protein
MAKRAENAEVWRDRVKRWKQSGLSARAFAELEGLPRAGALSWWRHRLAQSRKKAPVEDTPLRLVRVDTAEVVTSLSDVARPRSEVGIIAPIEVMLGDYRIVVRPGCDLIMLEGVLRAVERAR